MAPPSVIRLHPDDGVVIARTTLLPGAIRRRWRDRGRAHSRRATRSRSARSRRASRCGAMARSSASRRAPIAPGQHVHVQNCEMGDFAKDYAYGVDAKPTDYANTPMTFMGSAGPTAAWRRATTSASSQSVNCSRACRGAGRRCVPAQSVHRRRSAGGVSERRWRGGADAQDRLRHDRRRAAARAASHARRLRTAREFFARGRAWAWAAR